MPELAGDWVDRCLALGGVPSLELYDEAIAAGPGTLQALGGVLARSHWRDGDATAESLLSLHALRILGALAHPAAIPMLAGVLRDPRDPARHGDEAALALARIGGDALPVLGRVLFDRAEDTWIRGCAARGLMHAALRASKARARVVAMFEKLLRDPAERDPTLGMIVVDCARVLRAKKLLPAIFEAWTAGRVDPEMIAWPVLETELASRRAPSERPEHVLARRDPREDYVPAAGRTPLPEP